MFYVLFIFIYSFFFCFKQLENALEIAGDSDVLFDISAANDALLLHADHATHLKHVLRFEFFV